MHISQRNLQQDDISSKHVDAVIRRRKKNEAQTLKQVILKYVEVAPATELIVSNLVYGPNEPVLLQIMYGTTSRVELVREWIMDLQTRKG